MTPMMKQYLEIKKAHPDSILFFRLGDFYEMFNEDAKVASEELDLTLTSRDRGKHQKAPEEQVPMCGIPYHASEGYIARLIAKGYKVAICEQVGDPKAKGLVKRDILRVITPGTVMDAACLQDKASNFLAGLYLEEGVAAGAAFCDISTGKTFATAFSGEDALDHLINELGRFSPAESILSGAAFCNRELTAVLRDTFHCRIEKKGQGYFLLPQAEKLIRAQFGEDAPARLAAAPAAAMAMGGLLGYLHDTQKTDLSHIRDFEYYTQGVFMELDLTARRNLELTETLRGREKKGSLLWVLDHTKTPMGGRRLREFIERPLLSAAQIRRRSGAVEALVKNNLRREDLISAMAGLGDMERLIGRVVYGSAGGRDLVSLRSALERLPGILALLPEFHNRRLEELSAAVSPMEELTAHIAETLQDDPPFSVREGGLIRKGFHPEVDRLRHILTNGRGVITEMEQKEKERTGIRTLKISYNKVFGYYIEVSNAFRDKVPETYIRKQTLVGGERFITQELKQLEQEILTASERVAALEYELFSQLLRETAAAAPRIQKTARAVAEIDALCSLAEAAVKNRYCRPEVDESGRLEIRGGRHPVVEQMLKDTLFVPNDTVMGEKEGRVAVITGPNMAGKSTYMRQTALIVLMAQMGSFVPAQSAHIGVVDRIFTRVGASDDLASGQSTFMVEMTEVSEILRGATSRSLLILDEIGRGTSTYDGMAIARAVLEHCAKKIRAKTLFATHYHELSDLAGTLPATVNYTSAVKTRGEEVIFLRKILPGGADRSYGIEVARLAGLPEDVVRRAKELLRELENSSGQGPKAPVREKDAASGQVSLEDMAGAEVLEALRRCQTDAMTPLEAMTFLYQLQQKLR